MGDNSLECSGEYLQPVITFSSTHDMWDDGQTSTSTQLKCPSTGYPASLHVGMFIHCLLYTSDAADEEDSVDLGGRRIIKKKN